MNQFILYYFILAFVIYSFSYQSGMSRKHRCSFRCNGRDFYHLFTYAFILFFYFFIVSYHLDYFIMFDESSYIS